MKNTGARAGSEVVELYVGFPVPAGEPPRQLKGFEKVALAPGEEKSVQIRLDRSAFEYWDEQRNSWAVAQGSYRLMVGRSSRNIVWTGNFTPHAR